MIDSSNRDLLYRHIAWNGRRLRGADGLPVDLTFRRMLTAAFSPGKPFQPNAVRSLVRGRYPGAFECIKRAITGEDETSRAPSSRAQRRVAPKFKELLKRAIVVAMEDRAFQHSVGERKDSAPGSLQGRAHDKSEESPGASEVWATRFMIFHALMEDPDFHQYVLERESDNPYLLRVWKWGEPIQARQPTRGKEQSASSTSPIFPTRPSPPQRPLNPGSGSVWEGLFRPLMTSWLYVVPIALGAGTVGGYIIDRQAEVHLSPTIENNVPAVDTKPIEAQVARLEGAFDSNAQAVSGLKITVDDRLKDLRPPAPVINVRMSPATSATPPTPSPTRNITVAGDFWNGLREAFTGFGPLRVHLGNDRDDAKVASVQGSRDVPAPDTQSSSGEHPLTPGPQQSSVSTGTNANKPADSSLRLHLDFGDLNMRQLPYPAEMIPPTQDVTGRTPVLLEITHMVKNVPVPTSVLPSGAPSEYLYLCDWRIPARFRLIQSSDQDGKYCDPQSVEEQYHVFTRTAQYVKELDAYVSLDEASQRRFLLVGSRRIVLQVVPNGEAPLPPNGSKPAGSQGAVATNKQGGG